MSRRSVRFSPTRLKESAKRQDIQEIIDLGPEYYDVLSALRAAVRELKPEALEKAWTAFQPDVQAWADTPPQKTFSKPADVKAFQALYTKVFRSMTTAQKSALYERLVQAGLIQKKNSAG